MADRIGPARFDPSRTRRRLWWMLVGPWLWLVLLVGLVAAAAATEPWYVALGLGVLLLPGSVFAVRERHRELSSLGDSELGAFERAYFAKQLQQQRLGVVLEGGLAAVFGVLAFATGATGLAGLAAVLAAVAAARLVVALPPLARANRDVGGEEPPKWIVLGILFLALLLAPFYGLGKFARGIWRRLGGGGGRS